MRYMADCIKTPLINCKSDKILEQNNFYLQNFANKNSVTKKLLALFTSEISHYLLIQCLLPLPGEARYILFNPLTLKDLQRRRAVSPLNI
jgi:hypothetical protein